mmetsp:Transcript_10247/g.26089  ORF Transcript_10247/g.26089 Transcript_10247/m.26089 type:complete len:322 (-) Transcript_10247:421-1386(-)
MSATLRLGSTIWRRKRMQRDSPMASCSAQAQPMWRDGSHTATTAKPSRHAASSWPRMRPPAQPGNATAQPLSAGAAEATTGSSSMDSACQDTSAKPTTSSSITSQPISHDSSRSITDAMTINPAAIASVSGCAGTWPSDATAACTEGSPACASSPIASRADQTLPTATVATAMSHSSALLASISADTPHTTTRSRGSAAIMDCRYSPTSTSTLMAYSADRFPATRASGASITRQSEVLLTSSISEAPAACVFMALSAKPHVPRATSNPASGGPRRATSAQASSGCATSSCRGSVPLSGRGAPNSAADAHTEPRLLPLVATS